MSLYASSHLNSHFLLTLALALRCDILQAIKLRKVS